MEPQRVFRSVGYAVPLVAFDTGYYIRVCVRVVCVRVVCVRVVCVLEVSFCVRVLGRSNAHLWCSQIHTRHSFQLFLFFPRQACGGVSPAKGSKIQDMDRAFFGKFCASGVYFRGRNWDVFAPPPVDSGPAEGGGGLDRHACGTGLPV